MRSSGPATAAVRPLSFFRTPSTPSANSQALARQRQGETSFRQRIGKTKRSEKSDVVSPDRNRPHAQLSVQRRLLVLPTARTWLLLSRLLHVVRTPSPHCLRRCLHTHTRSAHRRLAMSLSHASPSPNAGVSPVSELQSGSACHEQSHAARKVIELLSKGELRSLGGPGGFESAVNRGATLWARGPSVPARSHWPSSPPHIHTPTSLAGLHAEARDRLSKNRAIVPDWRDEVRS